MTYSIQGFQIATQHGYDAERTTETLKDAKREARYMLSEQYRKASEATHRLAITQVWKDGELIHEFWR